MSAPSPCPESERPKKESPNSDEKKKKQIYYDPAEFTIRKRLAPHWPKRNSDVFISNKTDIKAQKKRCLSLIQEGESSIYLHALGAAVPRALTLALSVQRELGGEDRVVLETQTETVELTDDFEPVRADLQGETQTRLNSGVHLKLSCLSPLNEQ